MATHSKKNEENSTPVLSEESTEAPEDGTGQEEALMKLQIEEALFYKDWVDNPTKEVVSTRTLRSWRLDLKSYDGEMKQYARSDEATAKQVLDAFYNYASKAHIIFDEAALKLINDQNASNSERQSCQKLYAEYKKNTSLEKYYRRALKDPDARSVNTSRSISTVPTASTTHRSQSRRSGISETSQMLINEEKKKRLALEEDMKRMEKLLLEERETYRDELRICKAEMENMGDKLKTAAEGEEQRALLHTALKAAEIRAADAENLSKKWMEANNRIQSKAEYSHLANEEIFKELKDVRKERDAEK